MHRPGHLLSLLIMGAIISSTQAQLPTISGISIGMPMDQVKAKLGPSFRQMPFNSTDPAFTVVSFVQGVQGKTRAGWLFEFLDGHLVGFTKSVGLGPGDELGWDKVVADVHSRYGEPTYVRNASHDLHYVYGDNYRLLAPFTGNNPADIDPGQTGGNSAGVGVGLDNNLSAYLPAGVNPRCKPYMTVLIHGQDNLVTGYSFTVGDDPVVFRHNKQVHDEAMAKAKATQAAKEKRGLPQ